MRACQSGPYSNAVNGGVRVDLGRGGGGHGCQEHQESITNLETKLQDVMANAEKARKEATEYATHLEEEVETSKVRHIPFVRAGLFPYYCTLIRGSLNELM